MNITLTPSRISTLLGPYRCPVDLVLAERVGRYVSQLIHWNRRVSLTAVMDPVEIVRRHFGESFFAVEVVPISEGRLADVGSGAGFPGAAIALASPRAQVTLIEPNSKKVAFLETIRGDLDLRNLEITKARVEDCWEILARADFVTSRAFGNYDKLLKVMSSRRGSGAKAVFWLGESDARKIGSQAGWRWSEPLRIPQSERRVLLIGSPLEREL